MLSDQPYITDDRPDELLHDKISRLEREIAELRNAAERYRFMRDAFQAMNLADNLDAEQIDAAIDEAMKS